MLKNKDFSPEYQRASGEGLCMDDMSHDDHQASHPQSGHKMSVRPMLDGGKVIK
jgi:hypothetical protein